MTAKRTGGSDPVARLCSSAVAIDATVRYGIIADVIRSDALASYLGSPAHRALMTAYGLSAAEIDRAVAKS